MKNLMCWTLAMIAAPAVWAQPQTTPVDEIGNRARPDHAAKRFDSLPPATPLPQWESFGPKGANAKSVAASPTANNVRLAGVMDSFGGGGLYLSNDNGGYWQQVTATGGRGINDVQFASNGDAYAATQDGLFKSSDNGQNWDMLPLPTNPVLVQALALHPTNPQVVWAGLGQFLGGTDPNLVQRSDDGGQTWNSFSPPIAEGFGVTALGLDPANPTHVYVALSGAFAIGAEVWYSADNGATWEQRDLSLPGNVIWSFAFSGGTVYASGGQDFGSQFVGLYKTTDSGVNWTEVSTQDWPSLSVTSVAVDPNNSQRIYAGTQRAGLGVSSDGGTTWTFNAGGTGNFAVNDIGFVPGQPNQMFLAMGSIAVLRSTNGGNTFTPASAGINRLNVTSIAVNPLDENDISMSYAGDNDGGIFHSTDGGATWTLDAGAPLPRWQFLTFSPDGVLYATHDGPLGRGDDGVWVRANDGTWSNMGPGTVGTLDTQGETISVSAGPNPTILFGGTEGFFGGYDAVINTYNRNGSGTWEKSYESGAIQSEVVTGFAWVNSTDIVASMINFGFENGGAGGILRSTDGGGTWTRSETGYPFGWHAWSISARPSEPEVLYTASSEYTFSNMNNRIMKSTDGGVSWTDVSLFDTPPMRVMIADPVAEGVLYGADLNNGNAIRSTDAGGTFESFSQGLVGHGGGSSFAYSGASRKLYYGTSSGAYVTPLDPVGCAADFNGDGFLDFFDYSDYVECFETGNCPRGRTADFNGDDFVDFFDYSDYVAAFETGC